MEERPMFVVVVYACASLSPNTGCHWGYVGPVFDSKEQCEALRGRLASRPYVAEARCWNPESEPDPRG
jgi:hypothetical protein